MKNTSFLMQELRFVQLLDQHVVYFVFDADRIQHKIGSIHTERKLITIEQKINFIEF